MPGLHCFEQANLECNKVTRFVKSFYLMILASLCLINISAAAATLDGVPVDAVDNYPEAHPTEVDIGLGLLPLNPYYNGVSLGLGLTRHFSRNWAWEILSAHYVFPFQTGLTSELADRYFVNPETIEKLQYDLSSNVSYTIAYGKILLFEDYIRSFRASVFLGLHLFLPRRKHRMEQTSA